MKPLTQDLVDRLDFEAALGSEVAAVRNLLPREPGLDRLTDHSAAFCEWLMGQLRIGMGTSRSHILSARKHGLGIRPVPIVGIPERVLYRALTAELLRVHPPVDRTPRAYLEFVSAPVTYARDQAGGGTFWTIGQSQITHVVKTDLTAFYDYIDHSILGRELISISPDYEVVEALLDLLGEMEGRSFGLPQLLDSSDELSDLYARIVERGLIREGFPTWRFNDDFRIACTSYPEALRAIESLSRHARQLGLVISEHKTFTPTFMNYAFSTLGLGVDDTLPADIQPEEAIAEYFEADAQTQLDDALITLSSYVEPGQVTADDQELLTDLKADDYLRLRRAIRVLTREQDPEGVDHVLPLLVYVPALTPLLVTYLGAVGTSASGIIDKLLTNVSLSDWQALWLARLLRTTGLLQTQQDGAGERVAWLRARCLGPVDPALRAEAAWALAEVGETDFDELEFRLRVEPEVLRPWYMMSIAALAQSSNPPPAARLAAVRESHPLFGFWMSAE